MDYQKLWTVLFQAMNEAPEIKWSGKKIRKFMKRMEKILRRHNARP